MSKELFFNVGVAGKNQDFLLAGLFYEYEGTDTEVTRVVGCEDGNDWFHIADADGIVIALLDFRRAGKLHTMAVSRKGEVATIVGEARSDAQIPIDPGFLFDAVAIGSDVFACGSNHQVWRWLGRDWEQAGQGAGINARRGATHALYGLCAVSANEVYAVGTKGTIVRFDGRAWDAIDSPTNVGLHKILRTRNDQLVVVGRSGQVFRGSSATGWTSLAIAGVKDNFWGLCQYRDDVYCSTPSTLYRIEADGLKEVSAPNAPKRFTRLFANDSFLWATTGTDAFHRFDGKAWSELVCPENE